MLGLILIALTAMWQACIRAGANMPTNGTTSEKQASLKDLGFTNVKSVMESQYTVEKQKWESRYQLQFLSDADIAALTTDKKLITGRSTDYRGDIPDASAVRIADNYERIKKEKIYYLDGSNRWILVGTNFYGGTENTASGVFVVAPPELFEDGADITIKRDPMALVKTEYGYVVLAAW